MILLERGQQVRPLFSLPAPVIGEFRHPPSVSGLARVNVLARPTRYSRLACVCRTAPVEANDDEAITMVGTGSLSGERELRSSLACAMGRYPIQNYADE
jgi:hypothetical protein